MTKQDRLDELAKELKAAGVGSELAKTATQLVMGAGNANAKVVLIGEAPGKSEDETGRPFVGASGKFLDKLLASVKMSRDDIYITNIVKYRPPGNRDPTPAEKTEFWPYLQAQLEIIDPVVIATLGAHSLSMFIPGVRIGDVHGERVEQRVKYRDGSLHTWQIVPLYHPAAALYNGAMRPVHLNDFMQVSSIL